MFDEVTRFRDVNEEVVLSIAYGTLVTHRDRTEIFSSTKWGTFESADVFLNVIYCSYFLLYYATEEYIRQTQYPTGWVGKWKHAVIVKGWGQNSSQ